jgi:hypothetical protein
VSQSLRNAGDSGNRQKTPKYEAVEKTVQLAAEQAVVNAGCEHFSVKTDAAKPESAGARRAHQAARLPSTECRRSFRAILAEGTA